MQTLHNSRSHAALGYAACALAGGLWGTGFFFGKIAMREMSSAHMVLYRFLFACLGLTPILLRGRPGLDARGWRILLTAALLGVPVQFLLQFAGLARTTVSHASLMVGTLPVVLAVGASIFAHEHLDRIGWTALAVSSTGAALIAFGHSPRIGTGRCSEPDRRSAGGDLADDFAGMDFDESAIAARPFAADCDRLWIDDGDGDAGRVGVCGGWTAANPHISASVAGPCRQRPALHRQHDPAMELGVDARACFQSGRVSESGADDRFAAGC